MAGNANAIRAGKAYVSVSADDGPLRAALKKTEAYLKSWGAGIAGAGAALGGLGAALGAPLAVATKLFADAGSELADMSARTGMSVEALSALGHAATQTGTDLATVEGAARKMAKNLVDAATGSTEAAAAFGALGLDVERLLKLKPDDQFAAVAAAIGRIQNPTTKAAAAMQLLGKSGTALLPMIDDLAGLTSEARKLGLVMSSEDAAAADALGDALDIVVKVVKAGALAIGSALAPALTEVAGLLSSAAAGAVAWLRENRGLVIMAAELAAGLVVAGGALVVVGGAMSGLGSVLGIVSAGLGAVGATLAALVSPIGLVVAGLAAGTAAFLMYSEAGAAALAWLGDRFGALYTTATDAFKGMADAMQAGDLALAGQVLWAGLKVAWLQGTTTLQGIWSDWGLALVQIVADAQTAIAGVFLDLSAGVQSIWANLMSSLTGTWGDMIGDLIKGMLPFRGALEAITGADIGGAIDNGLKATGFGVTDPAARDAALQATQAAIGQQNLDARAALASGADAATEARRKAAADGMASAAADLAAAQADLAALTGKADNLRRAKDASTPGGPKALGALGDLLDPAGLDSALGAAKAKFDVAGSFNAAAFRGLGVGESVQNDQLKEMKKQTKEQETLNKKLDRAKLVMTD